MSVPPLFIYHLLLFKLFNSNKLFKFNEFNNWVNGNKVGKDAMWPLDHNAEICFAGANKKVFVFMSTKGRTRRKRATWRFDTTDSSLLFPSVNGKLAWKQFKASQDIIYQLVIIKTETK